MSVKCNKIGCYKAKKSTGCTEKGMEICNEMTSKTLSLYDAQGKNKLTFTAPDKDVDLTTLPNLGVQVWKVNESILIKYMSSHPELT